MIVKTLIENVNEIKVGDEFIIEKEPPFWSPKLNKNYPLDEEFPYKGKVKELGTVHEEAGQKRFPMTDGNFGWDLYPMVGTGQFFVERKVIAGWKAGQKILCRTNKSFEWKKRFYLKKLSESTHLVENRVEIGEKKHSLKEIYGDIKALE